MNIKKCLMLCFAAMLSYTASAMTYNQQSPEDTVSNSLDEETLRSLIYLKTALNNNPAYELYKTENIWTFLKLETSTGKIWQVQFSLGDTDAIEVVLSDVSLAFDGIEVNGRFKLYPTQNIYNFLLLDTQTGSVYQVQWSPDPENRVVLPIYRY